MMKKNENLIYSAIGLVALFLILIAVNFLVTRVPTRVDLTEGNLYTLSDGTRRILRSLESPVKVKLYMSQGEAVPVPLRGFAQRVEDLVREFKSAAGDRIIVERLNPRPDSEEEDAAQLDGVEPQQLVSGEQFYLGIAVSQLDRKQAIPAISPQRERLLEYDLVRAIARVGSAERPKIGLMAGLPVLGERFNPFTRQSSEPWVLANELKRDFDVKEVPLMTKEIDKDLNVLLRHPSARGAAADRVRARPVRDARRQADRLRRPVRVLRPGAADARRAAAAVELDTADAVQGLGGDHGPGQGGVRRGVRLGRRRPLHAHRALAQPHRLQPRRHRHQPDRDAALCFRRRIAKSKIMI